MLVGSVRPRDYCRPVSDAYNVAVSGFYQLANFFFWPVTIALVALFVIALGDTGRLIYQAWRRQSTPRTDLLALARRLNTVDSARWTAVTLHDVALSPALRAFWTDVDQRLAALPPDAPIDLWLEEVLQQHEMGVAAALDRSRALVRLGPMLGLAGTIIPLGPALQSLLGGDMASMVNHLVVGFGAVVCGLVLSGAAYGITLVRERWARVDLKEMENLCELVMRVGMPSAERQESRYARV
jgi:biopolymer transport protein ExbB/TolQ